MTFDEFRNELRIKLQEQNSKFEILNHRTKGYFWIGDGFIGTSDCHYEFIIVGAKLYLDIHFEKNEKALFFQDLINDDIRLECASLERIKWRKFSDALRLKQEFNIKEKDIVEKAFYELQKLDDAIGDDLRKILKNEENKMEQENKVTHYTKLLQTNRNLILTGAPGTGKTHLAKEIAKAMGAEYKLVQFHPSYDYTDFVEGLRPKNDDDGNVGFERKDGVFKEFCKRALSNKKVQSNFDEVYEQFIDFMSEENDFTLKTWKHKKDFYVKVSSKKNLVAKTKTDVGSEMTITREMVRDYIETGNIKDWKSYLLPICDYIKNNYDIKITSQTETNENKNYVFIIDEINRGEISKIFGELFFSIDPGYRGIDENGKPKGLVQTQYQNLIQEKDDDVFFDGFYVPENVYIIGTMNDIDRSVESMDFAFRRRFAFDEVTAEQSQSMLDKEDAWKPYQKPDEATIKNIKNRMNNLNNAIEQIEGLSSAYHIGASYFLKLQNYDGDFDELWEYHIEGLLREYLRGNPNADDLIGDLKSAYDNENPVTETQDDGSGDVAPANN